MANTAGIVSSSSTSAADIRCRPSTSCRSPCVGQPTTGCRSPAPAGCRPALSGSRLPGETMRPCTAVRSLGAPPFGGPGVGQKRGAARRRQPEAPALPPLLCRGRGREGRECPFGAGTGGLIGGACAGAVTLCAGAVTRQRRQQAPVIPPGVTFAHHLPPGAGIIRLPSICQR